MSVPGDQIAVKLELPLVAYPGDQVPIKVPADTVTPPEPVTRYKQKSWRIPWGLAARSAPEFVLPWQINSRRPRLAVLRSSVASPVLRSFLMSWGVATNFRVEWQNRWGMGSRVSVSSHLSWRRIPRVDVSDSQILWSLKPRKPKSFRAPWKSPPRLRNEMWIRSDVAGNRLSLESGFPWERLASRPVRTQIPWGQAVRVPWMPGSPGFHPPQPPENPWYVPPLGDRVYVRLICPLVEWPGDQVPISVGPSQCYFDLPTKRTYFVQNIVEIVRLPERTPIEFKSLSLSTSVNSLYWDFRGQLADPSFLGYLKKTVDGPRELEITLNGHVWRILVEDHDDQREFLPRVVNVNGRSRTCVLSEPYAAPRSRVETEVRTSPQLMEFEIDATGFTLDHFELSWVVPAGTWSYQGLTPIEAIKEIAEASGAIVMSHPWDSKLLVYPRFPVSPWDWPTTAVDGVIADAFCARIGTVNKSLPLYDYVFISGETSGVGDPIIRDGSAGEIRAEMFTHRLITTHPVALEKGRNTLSDRGEQAEITAQIPLFPPDQECGLVLPMLLIQFEEEPAAWKGLVTSTSITVDTDDAGLVTIWQNPTVERHLSDAN